MFRIDRSRVNISEARELQVTLVDSAVTAPEQQPQAIEIRPDPYEEAQKRAEELLDSAHREADAISLRAEELLHQAEIDSENLKTEATKLGYELGYSEGRAEGEQLFDALISGQSQEFANILAELKRAGETMISDMEEDIIDLCFSVLRKITALDNASDGEIFRSIIKKALSQVDLDGKISIRLSHEDYERFFPDGTAVFDVNDMSVTAAVVSDPEFAPGDIAVDTESETIIAGPETQLRNIELAFKYRIGKDNE